MPHVDKTTLETFDALSGGSVFVQLSQARHFVLGAILDGMDDVTGYMILKTRARIPRNILPVLLKELQNRYNNNNAGHDPGHRTRQHIYSSLIETIRHELK